MDNEQLVLLILGISKSELSPIQLQKIIFIAQDKLGSQVIQGFNFEPYYFGPFDKNLYSILNTLCKEGFVEQISVENKRWKKYRITNEGYDKIKSDMDNNASNSYLRKLVDFVKSLSFIQLLKTVYSNYPEMKVNSIIK